MPKNIFSFFSRQRLSAAVLKNLTAELLTFLEQFPAAVLLVDKQGQIGLVNPAAVDILKKESTDLVGQSLQEVLGITPQQLAGWVQDGKRHVFAWKNGPQPGCTLQVHAKKLGETDFVQLSLQDVPALNQLQTERNFLQQVIDEYAVAITVQDAAGRCLLANQAAQKLFGWNDYRGKVMYQLLPTTISATVYGLDEELKAGKSHSEPTRWTGSDGKVLDITKKWLSKEGTTQQAIVTFYENAAARSAHEKQLERDQKLLHAVLENIPLGLYTRDCDEKVTFFNQQSMQILNETSPYRTDHPNEYQQANRLQEYREREAQILKEGKTYEYPGEVYVDSSGNKKIVHMIKVPLFDAGPKPLVLTIVEDVTKRRQQEEEIQRVNSFFSAVVQNAPIGLYARGMNGRMLLRNKQCEILFGEEKFDARGGLAHETDDQVQQYINREKDIFQKGETLDIPEEEYINSNGEKKLLHMVKTPVFESNCVLTLVEDITSKKEQERALVDSKNFLQTVINQLPVSLSVKNYEGQYILWNKKSEELFGVAAEQVIGKNAYRTDLNKEQTEFMRETDLRVFEGKKEQDIAQELISSPKEGIKIMHTVKTPVFNSDGSPNCLLIVSEDITAKTKMEKQIREANDKNTLLVDNAREGVVLVEDGKIIYANRSFCTMLGVADLEEIKNKDLLDFSTENHRVFLKEKYEAVRSGADTEGKPIEAHFAHKDGTKTEAKFRAVLAKYLGRRVVLGFATDITEENRLLREAKNERDHFRQTFEKSIAPAFTLSPRGYISLMNAACRELFGFTEADKKFYCNVYIRPAFSLEVRKAMRKGLPARMDYTLDFDRAARLFPGRIEREGKLELSVVLEPLTKRDVKDGTVEADYLVCLQPKQETPLPPTPGTLPEPPAEPLPQPQTFAKTAAAASSLPPMPPALVAKQTQTTQWVLPNSEPYAICDENFVIIECNDLLCSLCALGKDELKGQDIRHLFHTDQKPLIAQDFALLKEEGKLSNREYTILLGSGLETCKVRLMAVKEAQDHYLFVMHSLTFHTQIMSILEERSAQLSALSTATDGALLRVALNQNQFGAVEQLNNWLSHKTSYLPEELAQYTFDKLFQPAQEGAPSVGTVLAQAAAELAQKGKARFSLPVRKKDGSCFQAQVVLTGVDIPLRNEALAVMTDLTALQETWSSNTKQAQELFTLLQALPGLYLRVNGEGKVLEVSSNLEGLSTPKAQELFLQKTPESFWPQEAATRALFTLKEVLSTHASSRFEFEWEREGKTHFYEAEVSALSTGNEALLWVKDASEKRVYDSRLHELYLLAQDPQPSMTAWTDKLLALGKQIFQTQAGLVLRFEPRQNHASSVVLYASENPFKIDRSMEFTVEECLQDVLAGACVLWPNLQGLSCTHCLHRAKNLGALVAAPLWVEGKVAGALCFAASEPRQHFLAGAEELLGLMARLLAMRIELRQAEKLLAVFSQTLSKALSQSALPALRLDNQLKVTYANAALCEGVGCPREQVVGNSLGVLVEGGEKALPALTQTLRQNAGASVTLSMLSAKGGYQPAAFEVFAWKDKEGHVSGYILTLKKGQ